MKLCKNFILAGLMVFLSACGSHADKNQSEAMEYSATSASTEVREFFDVRTNGTCLEVFGGVFEFKVEGESEPFYVYSSAKLCKDESLLENRPITKNLVVKKFANRDYYVVSEISFENEKGESVRLEETDYSDLDTVKILSFHIRK